MTDEGRLPPITGNGEGATVSLIDYLEAIRAGDIALREERDRRYAEVKLAEEKALRVKEVADEKAFQLASEIQTYKDTKANELREQIASERGLYVTRAELASAVRELQATIKPLSDYTLSDAGRGAGASDARSEGRLDRAQVIAIVVALAAVVSVLILAFKR